MESAGQRRNLVVSTRDERGDLGLRLKRSNAGVQARDGAPTARAQIRSDQLGVEHFQKKVGWQHAAYGVGLACAPKAPPVIIAEHHRVGIKIGASPRAAHRRTNLQQRDEIRRGADSIHHAHAVRTCDGVIPRQYCAREFDRPCSLQILKLHAPLRFARYAETTAAATAAR